MSNPIIVRGQRAKPRIYTCRQCRAEVHSYRTGSLVGQFCDRFCRDASRRLGNVNRYQQAGHWMLSWNDGGQKRHQWEHRRAWEEAHGPIPKGYIVHHRNGNGYDNRIENLECVTRAQHSAIHKTIGPERKRRNLNLRQWEKRRIARRLREMAAKSAAYGRDIRRRHAGRGGRRGVTQ